MESDLWISRLMAAKRQYALQRAQHQQATTASHQDRFGYDDIEPEDEACPVCSARVSKELLDHITLQHGYLFKLQRHHRLRRVAIPSNHALSLAGRDLQETYLKVLLGNSNRSSGTNTSSSVTDSLLSSLVINLSSPEGEDTTKSSASAVVENSWLRRSIPSKTLKTSPESNLSHEERERRRRRAAVKASFVQHLLVSTLFDD
ncbi:hypothetical protein BRADI_3g11400v3 [Brachypodium distachyon]|uniref:Di19 C-terminal domain-containing protein n=1 Tax=Brachypodium distachyon TaxID=15368 RepID=A0A2K2CWN9_BRADI|nr:hypothetical protein BRADI_3g11400v3 [Brachypodium distachyon]